MPNMVESGSAWFLQAAMPAGGRQVTFRQNGIIKNVTAIASRVERREYNAPNGRVVRRRRMVFVDRAEVNNVQVNRDSFLIDGLNYIVSAPESGNVTTQGRDYIQLEVTSTQLAASERENYTRQR